MKLNATTTSLILAVLYFGGAVVVLAGAVMYVDNKSHELMEQMEVVANDQQLEQQYNTIQTELENTAEQRAMVESFTLAEDDTIGLLAELESLAGRNGVTLETQNLEIGEGDFGEEVQQLTLSWQVEGQATGVRAFLSQMEILPYLSKMNRLSIRTEDAEEGGAEQLSAAGQLSIMLDEYAEQD